MEPEPSRSDKPPFGGLTAVGPEDAPCVLIAVGDLDRSLTIADRLAARGWRALRGGLTSDFPPGFRAIVSDDPATLLFGEAVWPEAILVAVSGNSGWRKDFEGIGIDWRLRGGEPAEDPEAWGPLAQPPT